MNQPMIQNESNLNQESAGRNQQAAPETQPSEGKSPPSPILSVRAGEGEARRMVRSAAEKVEPWPEPVDGNALLNALRQVLVRFVVLPAGADVVLALWTLHTYAFELRDVTTYIGIESPEKRCGKTALMTLLSELVNRPEPAANISSPAFFRAIEETQPTLLIVPFAPSSQFCGGWPREATTASRKSRSARSPRARILSISRRFPLSKKATSRSRLIGERATIFTCS